MTVVELLENKGKKEENRYFIISLSREDYCSSFGVWCFSIVTDIVCVFVCVCIKISAKLFKD